MLCNYTFHHIKISSLGLMIKHEQFNLKSLDQTHISIKYILEHRFGNSETLGYYSQKSQLNGSLGEPASHGHSRPFSIPIHDQHHHTHFPHQFSRGAATAAPIFSSKNFINSVPSFWIDQTAPHGLKQPKHS